ncbi:MAG: isoleucine--tRNA ligase [Gammaproteobacteria bacterium]|nr:isoleucine--tRNA ligase [Gammaproteobacteria bacterium]
MKAGLPQREPQMLKTWLNDDLYGKQRAKAKGRPIFTLHDGPPYANGDIHLGHAVNKVLKDIIIKSKNLSGFDAPYIPGWDCHGLPIELQVEKKIGKAGVKVDAKKFRAACREYAQKQVNKQREDFKRLGILGDWDNPYLTMNFQFEADEIRALGKIIQKGHMHKGFKPVHWCSDCGSALAEAEVEYKDKHSPAIDVRFAVLDDAAFINACHHVENSPGKGPISVVIWTTTPWTLPANEAVALNPELDYCLVECVGEHGTERLLLAEALHKDALGRWGFEEHRVVAYCKGAALENLKLQHPFYDKQVPIILGDHVTTDAGTGAVHTAPAHGQEDYVAGSRYHLPIDNPVGPNGVFIEGTELFAGQHVFKANDSVIETLKLKGNLVHAQALDHSYPHCWRHKTPIIFRATPQWFISMEQAGLRDQANQAIEDVDWIPDWGKARISAMMANRPDWCISRQRTWGVPIALFVHKDTSELHPNTSDLIEQVAQRVEKQGIDAWFDLDAVELLGADAENYVKVSDTLDVWFDSGVSHFAVIDEREELAFPADLYLEGSDQHRGWFQSSLLTSVAIKGRAPYKAALTHGFTVDAKGHKMSKSIGNSILPQEINNSLGADVLRLFIAATDYRNEMTCTDEIFKRTGDAYRRIRNTARFLLANLHGFDPAENSLPASELLALDQWAIARCDQLQTEIRDAYDCYEFHLIYQKVHNFCSVDLGGFYLDVLKDRQYTTQENSQARRSAQTAMYHMMEAFCRWIAPILSFTADEMWRFIPGQRSESVFLETWYELPQVQQDSNFNLSFWQEILQTRIAVSKELEQLRVAGDIGSSLDAEVNIYCGSEIFQRLSQLEDELRFVLITSDARIHKVETPPGQAKHVVLQNGDEIWIQAAASEHKKCVRCWHHQEDVGANGEHPELCGRCIENVAGDGEKRRYA